MTNSPKPANSSSLVISNLTLRKSIGLLGLFFPLILWLGVCILEKKMALQPTISDYYYTDMRNGFIGILSAVALFLFVYRGYESYKGIRHVDRVAGYLGCVFALGTAFFPTEPAAGPTAHEELIGNLHFIFAALFFSVLIFFSMVLFTETDDKDNMTEAKKARNVIYLACGYVMISCIIGIAVYYLFLDNDPHWKALHPVFWFESIALAAFGISWLVKGEIILKDRKVKTH